SGQSVIDPACGRFAFRVGPSRFASGATDRARDPIADTPGFRSERLCRSIGDVFVEWVCIVLAALWFHTRFPTFCVQSAGERPRFSTARLVRIPLVPNGLHVRKYEIRERKVRLRLSQR